MFITGEPRMIELPYDEETVMSRFDTIPERDGRTDGRREVHYINIATKFNPLSSTSTLSSGQVQVQAPSTTSLAVSRNIINLLRVEYRIANKRSK